MAIRCSSQEIASLNKSGSTWLHVVRIKAECGLSVDKQHISILITNRDRLPRLCSLI